MKKLVSNLLHKFIFRCESLSKLAEQEDLSWCDKTRAKLHFLMCKACQRYKCQLEMISETYRKSCCDLEDSCLDKERLAKIEKEVVNKVCKK
jgi:hypothetical protein